ncbi:MAG: hypothetical protein EGR88_08105 [Ruminococcus sp. SR1/5]|jgi:hypothetical protein|nr:hypothetical protein [Ruminococcus sp.]
MSETTGKRDVVQRHQIADYLNIGTSESPNWVLMGVGFTSLNETFGAESESSKYVNEASESSSVTSYKSVFPFEAHLIKSQEAVNALYTVGRNHLVGAEAEFEYCRVELFEGKASADSTYAARKFLVSAEVSSIEGDKKQSVKGNLNAVGDPVDGYFNTKTPAFTAA